MNRSQKSTGLKDSGPEEAGVPQGEDSRVCSWVQQAGPSGVRGALGNRVTGWVGGARSWPGCAAARVRAADWGAAPPGRGRGVRRGRADPAPPGKGPASCPRFRFRSGSRPSRTLTDSCLQSLRLHRGLHPPRAPASAPPPRPLPLSRELLGSALSRLKGPRRPR